MENSGKSNKGFLGERFESCPSCGELIRDESGRCRFCGYNMTSPATIEDPGGQASQLHADSLSQYPEIGANYTSDGLKIPGEYGRGFNFDGFSWPAYWFADLWHADKGLIGTAVRHFIFRSVMNGCGIAAIIIMSGSFTATDTGDFGSIMEMGVGVVLALLWFLGIAANSIFSYIDARPAYRNYTTKLNSSPQTCEKDIKRGRTLYWAMLYVPFTIFLLGFLTMLATIGNNEQVNASEVADKFGKLHDAIISFL